MRLRELLTLVEEYMLRTGLPVPAPGDVAYRWALERGPRLPRRGRVYLYTGALYQLAPYIDAALEAWRRASRLPGSGLLARAAARLPVQGAVRPRRELVEWSLRVVSAAAGLAAEAVEGLAYLYEDDLYSGVILYDLGLDEAFARHAEKVWARLKSREVEEIVTLDPHTAHVMRDVYPRYVDGYSLTVRSYLEALDEAGWSPPDAGAGERVAVHDPCLYARGLNVVEQPRRLLRRAGYEPVDPPRSRGDTYCCGGPVRAVAPSLSNAIAAERIEELASTRARVIVTMCPICFLNLSRAAAGRGGLELRDIAELLAAARR